jgi:ABC-type sugar transport system ATPase subunit
MNAAAVLSIRGAVKRYPGVTALDDVLLELRPGEVHAVVGENGAGKTTLIRLLSGADRPDKGAIHVGGEPVEFASPAQARAHGIVAIAQELALQPWLNVTANVVLGNEPARGPGRQILLKRAAEARTRTALARLGASAIHPRALVQPLSTARKQLVEIARGVAQDAAVVIMDEPTASLPGRDADTLLGIVREIRDGGGAVMYVSHRLEEVRAVADRISVLRNGRLVHTGAAGELSTERMIELMIGGSVAETFPPPAGGIGEPLLAARGLSRQGAFEDVSFELRAGEILGFAGLVGAGRTEVMRAIAGADRLDAGELRLGDRTLRVRRPRDAIRAGIAYMPEDRKEQGLVLSLSSRENIALPTLRRFSRYGVVRRRTVRARTDNVARRLQIRGDLDSESRLLSGGNQQKVVIGKWMLSDARVLIFDEATRGIDVGAKAEVYRIMYELAANGAGVIVVSSELPELLSVCHRLVVMSRGRVRDELTRDEFDEERILRAAFAGFTDAAA